MGKSEEIIKNFILKLLEEKKAEHIVCLNLKKDVAIADYMIFASGRSTKNIKAIAEYIMFELKHQFKWKANVEGLRGSDWILLDAGDVIVHLFQPDARKTFKIEELWVDKSL